MTILFKWLTAGFAVTLASSLVSMMAAFVGSRGADFQDLLKLQAVLVPVSIMVVVGCFVLLIRRYGYKGALGRFWSALPGWLIFAVLAINSLVLVGGTVLHPDPVPHCHASTLAGTPAGRNGALQFAGTRHLLRLFPHRLGTKLSDLDSPAD